MSEKELPFITLLKILPRTFLDIIGLKKKGDHQKEAYRYCVSACHLARGKVKISPPPINFRPCVSHIAPW
jgi:hypothetical protein